MKIGIIGAGNIGKAFAKQATQAGYEVIISNSRGPESLTEFVTATGGNLSAGTIQEAANAEVVFLSLPWLQLEPVASSIGSWEGKIVIDPSNPFLPGFIPADLGGKTSSEIVEGWVPGAKVVKAFNTLGSAILAAPPKEAGGSRVLFFSGNDAEAKSTVASIIEKMGYAGIDLGSLSEGGKFQQLPGGPLPLHNLIKL
jgi:hypothetical protein